MIKVVVISVLLVLNSLHGFGQSPRVPSKMKVAGIKLKITEAARKEIQKDVDALTHSEKYFRMKLKRVEEYFPLIERVFKEEGLPEDFKYLVIQESALIPDAVSTSNAVGYWQFKKESGEEVGLTISRKIDERMHIIASTRAAAKYLHKNNFYFNNWIHALQAYQMGAGGAMDALGDKDNGAKSMTINKKTYWYVKKFIAHKVAFENEIGKHPIKTNLLVEYNRGTGKTLREISKEVEVDESLLKEYNKWLKTRRIPDDKKYTVIIPIENARKMPMIVSAGQDDVYPALNNGKEPILPILIEVNDLEGIMARKGDTPTELARLGDITESKFFRYNDLKNGDHIREGNIYYLEKKRNRAKIHFHTAQPNETLWGISQKYGLKLKKLRKKNRIKKGGKIKPGRLLWLRKKRPKKHPVEYKEIKNEKTIVDEKEPVVKKNAEKIKSETEQVVSIDNSSEDHLLEGKSEDETTQIEDNYIDDIAEKESGPERTASGKEIEHIIKKGETLFSISRKYDITIQDLLAWNNLSLNTPLKIDQSLIIKNISTENSENELIKEKSYIIHEVMKGDTMYSISKKYGVSIENLQKWNGKTDFSLNLGEKVLIQQN